MNHDLTAHLQHVSTGQDGFCNRNLSAERSRAKAATAAINRQAHSASLSDSQMSMSAQRKAARGTATALAHVWFQHEDFVAAQHEAATMDTVLCLSVTKWVHLNGGDAALKCLFAAVQRVLTPGGHFVLEAQPWRSYKQALRKTVCLPHLTIVHVDGCIMIGCQPPCKGHGLHWLHACLPHRQQTVQLSSIGRCLQCSFNQHLPARTDNGLLMSSCMLPCAPY